MLEKGNIWNESKANGTELLCEKGCHGDSTITAWP